jgi:exopolysaccharide biosynthesis polyprenyl glycosylphosphotransferase
MMHWGHPGRDKVTLFLGDIALVTLAGVACFYMTAANPAGGAHRAAFLLVLLPPFLGALYVFDLYSLLRLNGLGTFARVLLAVGTAAGFCDLCFHLFQWKNPACFRSLQFCALFLPGATYLWRRCYLHGSRRLRLPEKILAVGNVRDAEILSAAVDHHADSRYTLLGLLRLEIAQPEALTKAKDSRRFTHVMAARVCNSRSAAPAAATAVAMARETVSSVRVFVNAGKYSGTTPDLGPATAENLLQAVATGNATVVVVRNEALTLELARVLTRLRFSGIQVYSLLDFCMQASEELPLEVLNEAWLCVADGFELLQARLFRHMKRLGDIFLAALGLLLAMPLMAIAAIAIWLDSPGPILYRQRRVGWMGRPFELLKFRSMHAEAEKEGNPQWAALNDPRITAVGRILRKTHFDEVPQMLNILRGEMSFVGPRPERPEFVGFLNESIDFYHLRHYVLPGITGWAQVNYPYGASLEDARRKLQYDLYYVCNASPLLDLRTLLRTARVVLFRQGSR